ncbi:MAG: ankyrin repeat domain-containing protein [Spirochaetes bacterium]|nr:ankyrin repeat domain-containing protein [Spirochaetota bacterium]MBN2770850.1 ankyrin repeat domain-containing protein [Spirochaetota bacterium]
MSKRKIITIFLLSILSIIILIGTIYFVTRPRRPKDPKAVNIPLININAIDKNGQTALHHAIEKKNIEALNVILKRKANVDIADKSGNTPLHLAVKTQNYVAIDAILKKKANVNLANKSGNTPLHLAVEMGSLNNVRKLLIYGADMHIKNNDGYAPYQIIFKNPNILNIADIMNEFRYSKDGPDEMLLSDSDGITLPMIYLKTNKYFAANQFLLRRKKSEYKDLINKQDKNGKTILHYFADSAFTQDIRFQSSKVHLLEQMLEMGADPTIADRDGKTAIHYLAQNKSHSISSSLYELMIFYGASLNVQDNSGNLPLHYSMFSGNESIINFLIYMTKDVNTANNEGRTPLHELCRSNINEELKIRIAEELISKGANINAKDKNGNSPLHFMDAEDYHLFEQLYRSGVSIDARNQANEFPAVSIISGITSGITFFYVRWVTYREGAKLYKEVRADPEVIGVVPYGTKLDVITLVSNKPDVDNAKQKTDWFFVSWNGMKGWVTKKTGHFPAFNTLDLEKSIIESEQFKEIRTHIWAEVPGFGYYNYIKFLDNGEFHVKSGGRKEHGKWLYENNKLTAYSQPEKETCSDDNQECQKKRDWEFLHVYGSQMHVFVNGSLQYFFKDKEK